MWHSIILVDSVVGPHCDIYHICQDPYQQIKCQDRTKNIINNQEHRHTYTDRRITCTTTQVYSIPLCIHKFLEGCVKSGSVSKIWRIQLYYLKEKHIHQHSSSSGAEFNWLCLFHLLLSFTHINVFGCRGVSKCELKVYQFELSVSENMLMLFCAIQYNIIKKHVYICM